jgi:hypothetical protein
MRIISKQMILTVFIVTLSVGLVASAPGESSAQDNATTSYDQNATGMNATEMSNQTELGEAGNISFFNREG